MKHSCIAAAVALSALVAAAETFVSEIPLLESERWWGGGGGDGQNQPYGAAPRSRVDLRLHGNTSSPLLVSSCGRYVWSEKPFGYAFKDGKLVIDSDVEKVEPVVAGKTLKDAYLAAAKAHMRFEGGMPPDEFFMLPQWNNWIEIFLNGMDQKAVDDYTEELAKSGFPCGVYMMDGGWLSHQGSYEFYAKDFPDPKGMFDRIRSHGWIPLIWTAHFVSPDSREYKKLRYHDKHDCLDYLAYRKAPGSKAAAAVRWWSGISAIYDLTKPEANAYYAKILREFADQYGIKGFKFDAGDPSMMAEDCRFHDEKAEPVDYTRLYAELAARWSTSSRTRASTGRCSSSCSEAAGSWRRWLRRTTRRRSSFPPGSGATTWDRSSPAPRCSSLRTFPSPGFHVTKGSANEVRQHRGLRRLRRSSVG